MKNMNLSNIHEWPLVTKILLLGLVFFTFIFIGYRYDLADQIKKLSRASQQEADLKQQIELVVRKNKIIRAEVSRLPKQQAELVNWKKQLVNYNDMPELLNQILKLGGDNNLFFSRFAPGESVKVSLPALSSKVPQENGLPTQEDATIPTPQVNDNNTVSYNKIPINVVVVGTYHQIANFISQVANMQWIVSIGNFTISKDNQTTLLGEKLAKQAETQGLLSAELTMDIYYLT